EQKKIIDIVINEEKSLFFTGSGGCEKTFMLNILIDKLYKKYKKYAIESNVWNEFVIEKVFLTKVFRQTDEYFVKGLDQIRYRKIDSEFLKFIKGLDRNVNYEDGNEPTRLFSTNLEVFRCNMIKMILDIYSKILTDKVFKEGSISGKILDEKIKKIIKEGVLGLLEYKSKDWTVAINEKKNREYKGKKKFKHKDLIEWFEKSTLVEETLYLKIGAEVLYIWNNPDKELANESRGKIVGFRDLRNNKIYREEIPIRVWSEILRPIVKFNSIEEEIEIGKETFQKKNLEGLTIPRLEIDCGKIFQSKQLYVALSRSVSIENLCVKNFKVEKLNSNKKDLRSSKKMKFNIGKGNKLVEHSILMKVGKFEYRDMVYHNVEKIDIYKY
ncbi:4157_t:CDS:2, partial [Scutellospora calospora]